KRGKNRNQLPPRFSLIPSGPIGDDALRAAIARYVGAVLDGNEDRYATVTGILRRDYPRFCDPLTISDDADDIARAIDAIGRLDCSHLLIQGPPGAGKTYTSALGIVEMLARGKRAGCRRIRTRRSIIFWLRLRRWRRGEGCRSLVSRNPRLGSNFYTAPLSR